MGRHASGPPPDPAVEWRSIWHATWVNDQGQEVEIAPWLRVVFRVLLNGALGVALVGSVVFSSLQLTDPNPGGALLSAAFGAVTFGAGVTAGEIRRRRRYPFSATARSTYVVTLASFVAGMPLLLHFSSQLGHAPLNDFDVAALLATFLCGTAALSIRFDDFHEPN
jgi:drug/metabolite transporter (DMT)-like permease